MKSYFAFVLLPLFIVVLAITMLVAHAANIAQPALRWHLWGSAISVTTGEILYQAPVVDKNRKPRVFATPQECLSAVMDIGPVAAQVDTAMVFRCLREDVLPAKGAG